MNREQFISKVEATSQALRRFLVGLCCGDTALADDIAQETLLKAYLSIDTFRDQAKFSSWLYRIAYNTFISIKRAGRQSLSLDHAEAVAADDRADSAFRYQALYAALDGLSEKERTAILLFYLQDYSIKEIAEIIDASEAAVKQQLSRGRAHLKGMLTDQK